MAFDISRLTFNPFNDYFGVVSEQGRVQVDSDWNEWLAELSRRMQAGTLDILGRAAYTATTPYAFQITATTGPNQLAIGPGRMYVDGLLAENHGVVPGSATWDPALAEMSGSPQPPPAPPDTDTILYTAQHYYPGASAADIAGNGPYLVYLDVWRRPITYLEDPSLIDPAVGVDTTGRLQTVWQVKVLDVSAVAPPVTGCSNVTSSLFPPDSAGLLSTSTVTMGPSGPCCLTTGTGYTGLENQFYRVEIHQKGTAAAATTPTTYPLPAGSGTATFKWSRDNASVATSVLAINPAKNSSGAATSQLSVASMGRDQVLGFAPGNWIELTDDTHQLMGQPGELHLIDSIDFSARNITLVTPVTGSYPTNPRIVRWDQAGKVYLSDNTTVWADLGANNATGDIPVPPDGTVLILESGITVDFKLSSATGQFNVADFWTMAARTATGTVDILAAAPPRGIHHHYTPLSVVTFAPLSAPDCRTKWPPGSGSDCGCCCSYSVGTGGDYAKIQDAVNALPPTGGEICLLPGIFFEEVVIQGKHDIVIKGCGAATRVASSSLGAAPPPVPPPALPTNLGFGAVFTLIGCQHIELASFAIEASGEAGIIVCGAAAAASGGVTSGEDERAFERVAIDTTIEELVITGDTHPAVFAQGAELLRIDDNRIAMANAQSSWPSVWVSGQEIHIDRNWVGLQTTTNDLEWLPGTVWSDITARDSEDRIARKMSGIQQPGGILIAGPSKDVYILENEIQGGAANGITLGSVDVMVDGKASTQPTGVVIVTQTDPCAPPVNQQIPPTIPSRPGSHVVAGGILVNILIKCNRIRDMGLNGIGPIGYFNLDEELEVISIDGLTIASNEISRSVWQTVPAGKTSVFGCGAIALPDVVNLTIRDNALTDFGASPGADVCGIFVLNGEMVEISRNQILETRDLDLSQQPAAAATGNPRGGIFIYMVTPPSLDEIAAGAAGAADTRTTALTFEPSLPALRIEHNVVRVPLGRALTAIGSGPFSIVNNHLSTGGTITVSSGGDAALNVTGQGTSTSGTASLDLIAATVLVYNSGLMLEISDFVTASAAKAWELAGNATPPLGVRRNALSGTVLFTNNICQLEARLDGVQSFSSVCLISLDNINFANNNTWVDGTGLAVLTDAFLLALSVNAGGNRFQEALGTTPLSGITAGLMNITANNIATTCLIALGPATLLVKTPNVILIPTGFCDDTQRTLSGQ